ncbi:MAG: response regulator [Oxalobacteraceae bacterium]
MPRQNILVVDDSPTERHFLSELLSSYGYQVSTADNGEAALSCIRTNLPHLIIMDVVMPGQNGFQTTREISRDPSTQHVPIIICSSKHQETDRIWGIRQGAREFMVKPVDPTQLLKKIASLLGQAG